MLVLVPAGTCLGSSKVSLYNCNLTIRSNLDTILHLIVYLLTFKEPKHTHVGAWTSTITLWHHNTNHYTTELDKSSGLDLKWCLSWFGFFLWLARSNSGSFIKWDSYDDANSFVVLVWVLHMASLVHPRFQSWSGTTMHSSKKLVKLTKQEVWIASEGSD